MEEHASSRLDSFLRFNTKSDNDHSSDPIKKEIHFIHRSEEHLIASTVSFLCRGMRYPNCDIERYSCIRSFSDIRGYPAGPRGGPARYHGRTADALAQGADEGRGKPR